MARRASTPTAATTANEQATRPDTSPKQENRTTIASLHTRTDQKDPKEQSQSKAALILRERICNSDAKPKNASGLTQNCSRSNPDPKERSKIIRRIIKLLDAYL
jgi:hypothetical protein